MTEQQPAPPPVDGTPAKAESLADRTKQFASDVVAEWVKRPIGEVGNWMRRRVLSYTIGLVLLCTALIFVMIGIAEGLRRLEVPDWASYLGVGVVAGLSSVIVLTRK